MSKQIKKILGTVIWLLNVLMILLILFPPLLVLIIAVSISIFVISIIFPILYYSKLMKQPIASEVYYLEIVENNHSHLEESLLDKMFEIRINNQRNFLYAYLALMAAFTFATLSKKDYFEGFTIYGPLNEYNWFILLGIIGILALTYTAFGFDRRTIKEFEILIKAKEKLKQLKGEIISPPN